MYHSIALLLDAIFAKLSARCNSSHTRQLFQFTSCSFIFHSSHVSSSLPNLTHFISPNQLRASSFAHHFHLTHLPSLLTLRLPPTFLPLHLLQVFFERKAMKRFQLLPSSVLLSGGHPDASVLFCRLQHRGGVLTPSIAGVRNCFRH